MCVLCSDLWDPFPMFTLKKSYIINVHCETQWLCIIICEEYVKKRAHFTLFPPYSLCTGSGSKGTKVDICVCRWKQINLEGIFPTKMKLKGISFRYGYQEAHNKQSLWHKDSLLKKIACTWHTVSHTLPLGPVPSAKYHACSLQITRKDQWVEI